jgi:hypothetical protein
MKHPYLLITFFITSFGLTVLGQDRSGFEQNFKTIDQELKKWDPVRGAWLSNTIVAMAFDERVPDRTFPEDFTPHQMYRQVPNDLRLKIASHSRINVENGSVGPWNQVDQIVAIRDCQPALGRSYGDPHLVSFDGARYSFQTVGEFRYAQSNSGDVVVQTRQKPMGDDVSWNTAVAMNVGGDRVCIYASDYPDSEFSTPIRVNGQAVQVGSEAYFLNNGGTVRRVNNIYVVDWPTGESLKAGMRTSGTMRFMNVDMNVFPCSEGGYDGLMGNANGIASDDFNSRERLMVPRTVFAGVGGADADRARQQWLSKEFAEVHRITQVESLFDYAPGQSTLTFTDRTFPRFYRSVHDLTDDRRNAARRRCIQAGVPQRDLNGCIYDNGFLDAEPVLPHVVQDPSSGTVLRPLDGETPNVNPTPNILEEKKQKSSFGAQPVDRIIEENDKNEGVIRDTKEFKENENIKNTGTKKIDGNAVDTEERKRINPWKEEKSNPTRIIAPRSTPRPSRPTTAPKPRPSRPITTPKPRPSTPKPSLPRSKGGIKVGRG